MSNISINKVLMGGKVEFDLLAGVEKTIILPYNVRFIEVVNTNSDDIYIAVGDVISAANVSTRLMTSAMNSVIISVVTGQVVKKTTSFKEVSFFSAVNTSIRFMNVSAYSLD